VVQEEKKLFRIKPFHLKNKAKFFFLLKYNFALVCFLVLIISFHFFSCNHYFYQLLFSVSSDTK